MHLRHGGAAQRLLFDAGKNFRRRPLQFAFQHGANLPKGQRSDLVLQLGQLVGVLLRQHSRAGRGKLAEFDKRRPQLLARPPQALRLAQMLHLLLLPPDPPDRDARRAR